MRYLKYLTALLASCPLGIFPRASACPAASTKPDTIPTHAWRHLHVDASEAIPSIVERAVVYFATSPYCTKGIFSLQESD